MAVEGTLRLGRGLFLTIALAVLSGCATPVPYRSFYRAQRDHPDSSAVVKRVPIYPRSTSHGGYAMLNMVADYWTPFPFKKNLAELNLQGVKGGPTEIVRKAFEKTPLWVHTTRGTLDELRARIRGGVPVTVLVQDDPILWRTMRFVLITGYDDRSEKLIAHDGASEPTVWPYHQFQRLWNHAASWMMTACPPARADWTLEAEELISLGLFYRARMKPRKAIHEIQQALELRPDRGDLHLTLGDLFFDVRDYPEAEKHYRNMVAFEPVNGRALNNLAYTLAQQKHHLDEALQYAQTAVELQPDNYYALHTLGYLYLETRDYKRAAKELERARFRAQRAPIQDQKAIALHLVWALHHDTLPDLARQVLQDLLKKSPKTKIPKELRYLINPGKKSRF